MIHYKSAERLLIQRFDAERPGLLELAAGVGPAHHVARLLADGAGDAGAEPLERLGRLLARHRRERARQHEHLARERAGRVGRRLGRLAAHVDAGLLQLRDERLVARFVGKRPDRGGHDRPDLGGGLQRLDRRLQQPVHRPEVPRERRGRLLADVADAERVDQPRQIVALAALDLLDDVAADLAQLAGHGALRLRIARRHDEFFELWRRRGVEVGEVVDEALLDQLIDERLAESFDVHRRARREVLEAAAQPRRTRRCSRSARRPPPRRGAASLPHTGQVVGITHGCGVRRPQARGPARRPSG